MLIVPHVATAVASSPSAFQRMISAGVTLLVMSLSARKISAALRVSLPAIILSVQVPLAAAAASAACDAADACATGSAELHGHHHPAAAVVVIAVPAIPVPTAVALDADRGAGRLLSNSWCCCVVADSDTMATSAGNAKEGAEAAPTLAAACAEALEALVLNARLKAAAAGPALPPAAAHAVAAVADALCAAAKSLAGRL